MEITRAQQDVRETFLGGSAGQLVSGIVWALSAAACTWHSLFAGGVVLFVCGFFIFPLTQLLLRGIGHTHALPAGHPMNPLGIQVAFTLPLTFPLILAVAATRPAWFYPAFMIALGAHYLPFVFMYGMWQYAGLSVALVAGGLCIALGRPHPVSLGAWFTATLLLLFAGLAYRVAKPKNASPSALHTHPQQGL